MVISAKKRYSILIRDWFTCQYCGKNGKEVSLEVDHITPKALWWTDEKDNLVCCCRECNMWKGKTWLTKQRFDLNNTLQNLARERIYDFYNERNARWLWTIDDNTRRLLTMFFRNWAFHKRALWRDTAEKLFRDDEKMRRDPQLWFNEYNNGVERMDVDGIKNIINYPEGVEALLEVAENYLPQKLEMDLLHYSEQRTVFSKFNSRIWALWYFTGVNHCTDKEYKRCEEWYIYNIYDLSPCERLNFWLSVFRGLHFDPLGLNTKIMEDFSLFPNFLRKWHLI